MVKDGKHMRKWQTLNRKASAKRYRRRVKPFKMLGRFLVLIFLLLIASFTLKLWPFKGHFPVAFATNGAPSVSEAPDAVGGSLQSKGAGAPGTSSPAATAPHETASAQDAKPTAVPIADPTPPPPKNPSELKMSWEAPAVFDGVNAYPQQKMTLNSTTGERIDYWVFSKDKPVTDYEANEPIRFGTGDAYTKIEGVLAWRGNNYRTAPAWGSAKITEKKLEIVWTKDVGAISALNSFWPGAGWTGQPLLVHWPESTRKAMNINAEMKNKDLVEVVYPVLDGSIYFLDLATGKPTRKPINVGYSFKGTGIIDPRGYPILYCGQGLNENSGKYGEFNYHIFNLLDQTELYSLYGRDATAFRKWGAWDSSGLVDAKTDTLLQCAENGMVYKTKLNTTYDEAKKTLTMAPQITKYRYHTSFTDELGIENSPAAYKNFLFFSDNGGAVQSLDLNTMKPAWVFNAQDDSDCTITVEDAADGVFLYTANEVDKRSSLTKKGADSNIRKLDAMTGQLIWQYNVPCVYHYYLNGGALATPLVGKDDISDLIIFNICLTKTESSGQLVALDKKTGKSVWVRDLPSYSWSSPVPIKGDDGKTYAVFCDFAGKMHLFDPRTGKDLDVISLGRNVEATPAVYNNMLVVGSYAQKIYGIKVK